MSEPKFLNDWASEDDMLRDFAITKDALEGAEVIVASYTYEDYCGDAYVLLRRGDELFEVHGGHCSCYGLESQDVMGEGGTQWKMEPAFAPAILHRVINGTWGEDHKIRDIIIAALERP